MSPCSGQRAKVRGVVETYRGKWVEEVLWRRLDWHGVYLRCAVSKAPPIFQSLPSELGCQTARHVARVTHRHALDETARPIKEMELFLHERVFVNKEQGQTES